VATLEVPLSELFKKSPAALRRLSPTRRLFAAVMLDDVVSRNASAAAALFSRYSILAQSLHRNEPPDRADLIIFHNIANVSYSIMSRILPP
jgi:hypothetical protein